VKRSLGLASMLIMILTTAVVALPAGSPGRATAAAEPEKLTLVSQALDLAVGAAFDVVVAVPAGVDLVAADTTVVITAYERITTRVALHGAIDGILGRAVDTVDLNPADIPRNEAGQLLISVPTETNTRTNAPLQLPREGVYPITIEVRPGDTGTGDASTNADGDTGLITFVRRLADPTSESEATQLSAGSLQVAFAVSMISPVRLDTDLQLINDPAAKVEIEQLREAAATSPLPLTIELPPKWLDLLEVDDRAVLAEALRNDEVLASTSLPIDPSVVMQAGQPDLATQWLRNGEDVLRNQLGVSASRSIHFVDEPISKSGAALLRELGVRMLVMTREQYDQLPDRLPDLDVPQMTGVRIDDEALIDMALPQPALSALLDSPVGGPAHTAILAAAELVTLRNELLALRLDPERSGVVVAKSDLGVPDPATLAAITTLISTTQGLRGVTLDEFSIRTDRMLFDGRELVAGLPDSVDAAITDRLTVASALTDEALQASSMLPEGSEDLTAWLDATAVLPSSAVSDNDVAAIADDLRERFATIRSSVGASVPSTFTLTGRDSELKLRMRNDSDRPLTVLLKLESPKLNFPDGPQLFTIPVGGDEATVRVTALTNGTFGLTLRVVTPYGDSELSEPIPLEANVNALSGLGKLATGVLIALVLLWWVRNWRTTIRKRRAAPSLERHPVSAPASAPGIEQTATLPPS
jgi:hypothetical protein